METAIEISPKEVVQQCYADFATGNIPGILDALTDDVQWQDPGHVGDLYVGLRDGKAAVAAFFPKLMERLNLTQFDVNEYITQGNKVVANGFCAGTARATGNAFAAQWSMTWRVNDEGKVSSHYFCLDTYNIAQAMGLAN